MMYSDNHWQEVRTLLALTISPPISFDRKLISGLTRTFSCLMQNLLGSKEGVDTDKGAPKEHKILHVALRSVRFHFPRKCFHYEELTVAIG